MLTDATTTPDTNQKPPIGFGKSPRNKPTRRSLSGAPLTYLFETKFQHFKTFQKTQNEARGLNFLLAPSTGALYRSSMPATPIATPLFNNSLRFTEQSLHERMKLRLHQSPRKSLFEQPGIKEVRESQLDLSSPPSMSLVNDRITSSNTADNEVTLDQARPISSTRSPDKCEEISSSSNTYQIFSPKDEAPQTGSSRTPKDEITKRSKKHRKKNG